MADFVSISLSDANRSVLFEAAESDLVASHSGGADVIEVAAGRLEDIALAASTICGSIRDKITPSEMELEIGVGVSGELGWFVAKSTAEANIKLTLTWKAPDSSE